MAVVRTGTLILFFLFGPLLKAANSLSRGFDAPNRNTETAITGYADPYKKTVLCFGTASLTQSTLYESVTAIWKSDLYLAPEKESIYGFPMLNYVLRTKSTSKFPSFGTPRVEQFGLQLIEDHYVLTVFHKDLNFAIYLPRQIQNTNETTNYNAKLRVYGEPLGSHFTELVPIRCSIKPVPNL